MSNMIPGVPFTLDPAGRKYSGVKHPDGSESGFDDYRRAGIRALLYGDSMTDQHNVVSTPSSVVNADGVLTVSGLGAPGIWNGSLVTYWNRTVPSLLAQYTTPATRLTSTSFTIEVPAARSLPNGTITGTNFIRWSNRISDMAWTVWLQMLGVPLNVVRNVGQSGDTVEDNLRRWATDVAPFIGQFDMIVAQMPGINDQSTGNGALTDFDVSDSLERWLSLTCSVGVPVLLGLITPVGTGEPRGTLAIMNRVNRLNRVAMDFARSNKNLIILDHHKVIVDPASTTGLAAAGLMRVADNIHYNVPAARRIALADLSVFRNISPSSLDTRPDSMIESVGTSAVAVTNGSTTRVGNLVTVVTGSAHGYRVGEKVRISVVSGSNPSQDIRGWRTIESVPSTTSFTFSMTSALGDFSSSAGTVTVSQSRNLFPNPLLTTTTGGTVTAPISGVSALGITSRNIVGATNTGVASVVDHPQGIGKVQQIVLSAAANGELTGFRTANINTTLTETMAAGQEFLFECELLLSSTNWASTPISEFFMILTITADGNDYEVRMEGSESGVSAGLTENGSYYISLPPLQIPLDAVSVTAAYFTIAVRTAAAFSAGPELTIGCARIAVWQAVP